MFGLAENEWRDLLLSVNIHRKTRRLSPAQAAGLLNRALNNTTVDSLSDALGFQDTTTLRKIARLHELPADIAATVDWGTRRGCISMSTAAVLQRLGSGDLIREAATAAIENNLSRDETRQVVQVRERSGEPIAECVRRALATRPRIERSELIIGSLLSPVAQNVSRRFGNDVLSRKLRLALAQRYPDVVPRALRINGDRFSILLSEADATTLRVALAGKSIEAAVTDSVEGITVA